MPSSVAAATMRSGLSSSATSRRSSWWRPVLLADVGVEGVEALLALHEQHLAGHHGEGDGEGERHAEHEGRDGPQRPRRRVDHPEVPGHVVGGDLQRPGGGRRADRGAVAGTGTAQPAFRGSFSTTRRRALSARGLAASSEARGVFGTPRTSRTVGSTSSGSGRPGQRLDATGGVVAEPLLHDAVLAGVVG